ncbi:hypothetical protein ElyMa_006305000 [Elysia marginata]|uniref:Uncharacterized protein n=1 Tax=Elysia marginata TaxID=1093978 RepID=A0AAV4HEN7_9GAST|nr:hypothetical protein ElyMa_006305000 [Elysia marginata]
MMEPDDDVKDEVDDENGVELDAKLSTEQDSQYGRQSWAYLQNAEFALMNLQNADFSKFYIYCLDDDDDDGDDDDDEDDDDDDDDDDDGDDGYEEEEVDGNGGNGNGYDNNDNDVDRELNNDDTEKGHKDDRYIILILYLCNAAISITIGNLSKPIFKIKTCS